MNLDIDEKISILTDKLKKIKSLSVFGFKERMEIERIIYLILLDVVNNEVSGFSNKEFNRIIKIYESDQARTLIIKRLFELRSFIKEISSGNAYVRDLALEKANTNRIHVFNFLENQLDKLEEELKDFR